MIRGVSLDWLRTVCSTSTGEKILLSPTFGLEVAFFPKCTTLEVCSNSDVQRAWILLLISSMENLKRTGLETLLGLNKAGRRVFLYVCTFFSLLRQVTWSVKLAEKISTHGRITCKYEGINMAANRHGKGAVQGK